MNTNTTPPIPQHSSKSSEHYTPAYIVEPSRTVLGTIDFDPASCAVAQTVIKAHQYVHLPQDGLECHWFGRVFLNPPGGRIPRKHLGKGTKSYAALWWHHLARQWQDGIVKQAIFIGFSLEILRSAQSIDGPQPLDFPFCIPKKRIAFDTYDWMGERIPSTQPTNANVIVYLPPRESGNVGYWWRSSNVVRFSKAFTPIGECNV